MAFRRSSNLDQDGRSQGKDDAMPYILVESSVSVGLPDENKGASASHTPWQVNVWGLKTQDLSELSKTFQCDRQASTPLIVRYTQYPPVVILNAIEVLGYRVVASSSYPAKNHTWIVWTMRREFPEPEPGDNE